VLTQERLKELFNYNPNTGAFTRLKTRCAMAQKGDSAGYKRTDDYVVIFIDGHTYRCHRLAWLYVHGEFPEKHIDHINGVRFDNRIANLRCVDNKENSKNQRLSKRNTSGVYGVYYETNEGVWAARIRTNHKRYYLGRYKDKFEAICARKSAENKYGFHENHGKKSR